MVDKKVEKIFNGKKDIDFGLDDNFEKILNKKYKKGDQVLMRISFVFENSENIFSKKWVKEAIINQIT